jgi:hypothetical protein
VEYVWVLALHASTQLDRRRDLIYRKHALWHAHVLSLIRPWGWMDGPQLGPISVGADDVVHILNFNFTKGGKDGRECIICRFPPAASLAGYWNRMPSKLTADQRMQHVLLGQSLR